MRKSDLSYLTTNIQNFTKNKVEDAYQNLALFNELTALNIEEKLNKAKVAGINLEIDEYKEK
jgi:hypothetical protein